MVDADLVVAVPDEQVPGGAEQLQPFLGRGQAVRRDHRLPPRHPRHMGIAVKRNPVGADRQQALHAVGDPRPGLVRQAIEDVGVQAGDAAVPQPLGDPAGDVIALDPADRRLDQRVEILDADAGPGHPGGNQRVHPRAVDLVRVDLDRELGALGQRCGGAQGLGQPGDLVRSQQRRRAAAPVQPGDPDSGGQMRLEERDLGQHGVQIGADRVRVASALGAAGAEPAQPLAERDMQVERDLAPGGNGVDPRRHLGGADMGTELRCRGIAGVPGHPAVKESQPGELI